MSPGSESPESPDSRAEGLHADAHSHDGSPAGRTGGDAATGWRQPGGKGTTTLLLRHGQTALSAQRRFAGRGDIPLTDIGRQQAAATAAALAARHDIDLVVTSPLRRAKSTAEAVADAAGAPVAVDEGLVETDFGDWEGLSFAEVSQRWPAEMAAWLASAAAGPTGGESFAAVARRVDAALNRILDAHQGRTVVVVSHVTPIKTIVCKALLAPPAALFRMHLDVASVSEATWFADGAAVLRSFNDTAHLRDAEHGPRMHQRGHAMQ
jgi:ribonuclease H / adenosylcobalamin/alpha-ribazole phosphatase